MLFPTPPLQIATDVWLLKSFCESAALLQHIHVIAGQAPFRHYTVQGGQRMSVAMTSCGALGWTSSEQGYAYTPTDPLSKCPWSQMPHDFKRLARSAASAAGWPSFEPDSCLINRYKAGAAMGLHQDRNEQDLSAPIVSVSIGATAKFMLGGQQRTDAVKSFDLQDGDVMVWGGSARLVFHGVRPQSQESSIRYNLTFRKAA